MRDRHFREDENELPYLVSSKRDPVRSGGGYKSPIINAKNVPFREFPAYVNRLNIPYDDKRMLVNSIIVEPENCSFSFGTLGDDLKIEFFAENQYVKSYVSVVFDGELYVSYWSGNYDGLESMQWFKNEVRRIKKEIGKDFWSFAGGFHHELRNGIFRLTNDCSIVAYFGDGSTNMEHHLYNVDFDARRLKLNIIMSTAEFVGLML